MNRTRNPIIALAAAGLLAAAVLHDVVPHQQIHVALAQHATPTPGHPSSPTPTVTRTSTATSTPFPTITSTLVPTATATATNTPIPPTATPVPMIEGVPICGDHVSTVWHSLVKRDGANAITCTYGHEHHDDPSTANDVFGPVGAWAGMSGQSISYPWQTSSPAGPENVVKHEGYKWYVATNQPCRPAWAAPNDGCFISWRVQVHSLGTASDAVVRFHSFSMEAVVEHQGQRGILRHGGHFDGGHLSLLADNSTQTVCPVIPSNATELQNPLVLESACGKGVRREHSGANLPDPYQDHSAYRVNWYSTHKVASVGPQVEEWGPIDFVNPNNQLYYPASAKGNNSNGRIENMSVQADYPWLKDAMDAAGLVRFSGYTDRAGNQVSGCSAASVDCVPLSAEGVRPTMYIFNAGRQGMLSNTDHNVNSPVTGKSLIAFPN